MKSYCPNCKIMYFVIFFFTFLGLDKSSWAATITVCASGCDKTTVQEAVDIAVSGDTVSVGDGTYAESVWTAANNVIIKATAGKIPHIRQMTINHNNITLDGLYFDTTGETSSSEYRITIKSRKTDFLIENCKTGLACSGGVAVCEWGDITMHESTTASGQILNNSFDHPTYLSMGLSGTGVLVQGNKWTNCHADTLFIFGTNHVIRGNEVSGTIGDSPLHADFVQGWGTGGTVTYGHLIEGNYVHDGEMQGCNLSYDAGPDARDWTFRNNVFVNIPYAFNSGMPGVKWYNNTFIGCTFNTGGPIIFSNNPPASISTNSEVINNIFVGCGSPNGNSDSYGWWTADSGIPGFVSNNNYVSKTAAGGYLSKSGWNTSNGNINGGDPKFTSYGTSDFTLQSSSLLKDVGDTIARWTNPFDKNGVSRPQGSAWDIGAYEYVPGGDTTPPAAPTGLSIR